MTEPSPQAAQAPASDSSESCSSLKSASDDIHNFESQNLIDSRTSTNPTVVTTPGTSVDNVEEGIKQMAFSNSQKTQTPQNTQILPSYSNLAETGEISPANHSLFFHSADEVEHRLEANIPLESHLPQYSPATYRLAVVVLKFERNQMPEHFGETSSFPGIQLANPKQWTPVVLELNSCQLNMYQLNLAEFQGVDCDPEDMIAQIREDKREYYGSHSGKFRESFYDVHYPHFQHMDMFKAISMDEGVLPLDSMSQRCADYNRYHGLRDKSSLRSKIEEKSNSVKRKGFFRNFSFASSSSVSDAGGNDIKNLNTWGILKQVIKEPHKHLCKKRLIKSFSLQYGKVGIANDFVISKKEHSVIRSIYGSQCYPDYEVNSVNALRLRLEIFQILIDFKYLNELINWFNSVTVGIDVALDLQLRELPKFNNVPSRRHRRRRRRHKKKTAKKPEKSQLSRSLKNRALNSANDMMSRSRRNTLSSTNEGSSSHNRQSSVTSDSSSNVFHSPEGNKLQQLQRLKAKNSPILNYFMSEFETRQDSSPRKTSFDATRARMGSIASRSTSLLKSKHKSKLSIDGSGIKDSPSDVSLNKKLFMASSRERSNSLNKLNMARSPNLLIPQASPVLGSGLLNKENLDAKQRLRAGSTGSKITLDSVTGEVLPKSNNHASKTSGEFPTASGSSILSDDVYSVEDVSPAMSLNNIFNITDSKKHDSFSDTVRSDLFTDVSPISTNGPHFSNLSDILDQSMELQETQLTAVTVTGKKLLEDDGSLHFEEEENNDHESEEQVEEEEEEEEEEDEDDDDEDDEHDIEYDEDYEEDEYGRSPQTEQSPFFQNGVTLNTTDFSALYNKQGCTQDIYKWEPLDKTPTLRRIIKDSIKSMPVLKVSDTWVNSKILYYGKSAKSKVSSPEYRFYQVTIAGVANFV